MKARKVTPEFFENDMLALLPCEARLLYLALWMSANAKNEVSSSLHRMQMLVFPYRLLENNVAELLKALQEKKLIEVEFPSALGAFRAVMVSEVGLKKSGPGRAGKSEGKLGEGSKPAGEALKSHPWLTGLDLYLKDAKLGIKIWDVDKSWMAAFPGVDIGGEVRRAHAWELANPARQKVNRIRFLHTWLSRAQDRGGSYASSDRRGHHQGVESPPEKYDHLIKH